MLFSIKEKLPFSIGSLFRSFFILPNVNENEFYKEELLTRNTYYNMIDFKTNLRQEPLAFSKSVISLFIKKSFFCDWNREMVENYFDDMKFLFDLDKTKTKNRLLYGREKQNLENLFIWPTFKEVSSDFTDEEYVELITGHEWAEVIGSGLIHTGSEDFWQASLFCLMCLIREALRMMNIHNEPDVVSDVKSWDLELSM